MENKKKLGLILSLIAVILFTGCQGQDIRLEYVIEGNITEYIEYYPATFSTSEKCMLAIDGVKRIITDSDCDLWVEGDTLYVKASDKETFRYPNYRANIWD